MDDGRDRHARHVRGLVAASEVLARPGLSARGRLRRLCDVADAAIAGHRTAFLVDDGEGGFRLECEAGAELSPAGKHAELAILTEEWILERLTGRRSVVLSGGAQPEGRGLLVLSAMALEGRLWGCLAIEAEPGGAQRPDDLTVDAMSGLANMAAQVLLAESLRSDRAAVLSRNLLTEQRNRRRIASRLHDGPQQILVSLRLRLEMLGRDASGHLADELRRLTDHVEVGRDDLRSLILDLDTMTGHSVLTNALRSLLDTNAAVASWRTTFDADDAVDDVDEEIQFTVERVVQEALANARQHARASAVAIRVHRAAETISVVVSDDGVGIPPDVPTTSTGHGGIRAMHERSWFVGGTLHIGPGPEGGTRVVLTVPRHI